MILPTPGRKAPAVLLLLGLSLLGGSASALPSVPERLKPRDIRIGPEFGLLESRFTASPQYRSLVMPTTAQKEYWTTPSWGLSVTARWSHWFSLTLSPRRETYRAETREETVSFEGNPFPHSLKARSEMTYTVWPLVAGMGWEGSRQHLRAQLGLYRAVLDEAEVAWIVDGEDYPKKPNAYFEEEFSGWLVCAEYGFRMGPGEWVAGVEAQRATQGLMAGMEGSIKARSTRIRTAYLWTVFRK